ncbi:unnamed protein product [Vitrella brassicaformis CCMP3155]|uniref:Plastid lipid-associated protein/fibrillin conserved domain-containing protein n=1 Tax=Vitrella brassicaformis (strain CCMP3155) TaxID=1169540 RepID=A0A0G4GEF6_VITBC|nr:unnamed protein product [Vitrella brassicaformis CCMP3155]|eukprot:CEM27718.1 unnamed protein product [Vitrella brassicaformis CCMP3155]
MELRRAFRRLADRQGLMDLTGFYSFNDFAEMVSSGDLERQELREVWDGQKKVISSLFEDVEMEEHTPAPLSAEESEWRGIFIGLSGSADGALLFDKFVQFASDRPLPALESLWLRHVGGRSLAASLPQFLSLMASLPAVSVSARGPIELREPVEEESVRELAQAPVGTVSPSNELLDNVPGGAREEFANAAKGAREITFDAFTQVPRVRRMVDVGDIDEVELWSLWSRSTDNRPSATVSQYAATIRRLDQLFEEEVAEGPPSKKLPSPSSAPPSIDLSATTSAASESSLVPAPSWIPGMPNRGGGGEGTVVSKMRVALGKRRGGDEEGVKGEQAAVSLGVAPKESLMALLRQVTDNGLSCPAYVDKNIRTLAQQLNQMPENFICRGRKALLKTLAGGWKLDYTSSDTVRFNKGLSGLAKTIPGSIFMKLEQQLLTDSILSDFEYTERIGSVDVTLTGVWDVRLRTSQFTNKPVFMFEQTFEKASYGFVNSKCTTWPSLRPYAGMELVYVDADLQIVRGNAETSLFVFSRIM